MSQAIQPIKRLIPLLFMIFLDSLGYFLVIPVLLQLFMNTQYGLLPAGASLATRNIFYGIAVMLSPLAFLIASPLVGHFSDKYGRKKTLMVCLSAGAMGFLLPIIGIVYRSVSLVLIGRFIAGASTSSQPVAQAAITDFSSGKKKAFYLSLIAFAMTLAMVLGPIGGSYLSDSKLISWFNVTTPYWIAVLLTIINLLFFAMYFNDAKQPKPFVEKDNYRTRLHQLIQILSSNSLFCLMIVFLLMELGWSQYYQVIFLYLAQQFHYSVNQIGLFVAYAGLWMSLGLTVFYRLFISFFSVEQIAKFSLSFATLGLIGCCLWQHPAVQWIMVIPVALFIGTAYPSLLAIMSDRAPGEHQGLVLGMVSTLMGASWMTTAVFGSWLISFYLVLPLMMAAVFAVAAAIIIRKCLVRSYGK